MSHASSFTVPLPGALKEARSFFSGTAVFYVLRDTAGIVEYDGSKELLSFEFPLENGTRVRCSPPSVEVGNWVMLIAVP